MHFIANTLVATICLLGLTAIASAEPSVTSVSMTKEAALDSEVERPIMDVVFCLDSTGSMGGEIQAAKEKIWEIANSMLAGEPKPLVRFGIVTYRDKGDEYVVKKHDLTEDIDEVHEFLMGINAGGGGDGPEDVRSALKASVHDMTWAKSKDAIKVVFLVGDAPPHEDYAELPAITATASAAVAQGININTIACGGLSGRGETLWKKVAELSDGDYQRLPRSGGGLRMSYAARAGGGSRARRSLAGGPCTEALCAPCAPCPAEASAVAADSARFKSAIIESLKKKAEAKGMRFTK